MKKIISLILTFFLAFNISNVVFAVENNEETITLSQFMDAKKEAATSVQIYINGNNYEIDSDKFFQIADTCMITPSSDPQPIAKDGMYIGITSNDVVSSIYISKGGGIDNAVPASGRQLRAVYSMDDVSYVNRIIELIPEIPLSKLEMFDKETVEKIKLYSPSTGTEAGYDGEASIEGFFNTADNITLKINANPYEISKNGLYMTVYDKNGNEGYIYITESGEIDYYSVYDREAANPKATYITKNIDEIKALFESVRPRTYATNAALNHNSEQTDETQHYEYILPMEYTRIDRLQNCYIAYGKQEKCAIYSLNGEKLSDDYDYIGAFYNEQVAEARKDNEYYIINTYGTVIGKFDKRIINVADYVLVNLSDSNDDGRPYSYFEGEFGVYTYSGELVKVLSYEKFKPSKTDGFGITFTGERLLFQESGKWGAVDSSFNTVIEPVYDKIYPFSDTESGITIAIINGKYGLIDRDGNIVADFVYDAIESLYSDGKINAYRVMQGESYMAMQGEKYGLLDKNGKMIKQLDELVPKRLYEEYNLIEVCTKNTRDDSEEYGELYGLIDYNGNIVIPIEHTNIWNISDGIIAAQKSYDRCGYYDISGNEITEFKYRMVSPFSEGLAFASSCINDVWSHEVINTKGEVVFNPDNWANGFYEGIAQVETGKFIDTDGKVVIDNPEWETVSGLNWWSYKNDGTFIVSDGENYGVAKYTGFISQWAKEAVAEAKKINLINADENYNYTAVITREEFCEFIFNYFTTVPDGLTAIYAENPFADTDNTHISVLNALGVIKGKSETEFAPNDYLTREEAATIIFRLINTVHSGWTATEQYFDFADSEQISYWAMNSIQVICNMGIMKGVGDNNFAPQDLYTIDQAIATLVRVYDNFNNQDEIVNYNDLTFADKLSAQMPIDKNYMFSPLSVKMALALAAGGAEGDTKNEILNAVEIKDLDEFNKISKDLIKRYSQTDILSLNIANSIWINKDKTTQNFSNGFKKLSTEYYNADVKTVDNKNAVGEINSWVNDKTNGKIPQIIENADNFWAMLINAIYFKGAWQDEFSEYLTKADEFTNADGTKTQTYFMNKTSWMPYAETKSAKIIKLPYKNRMDKISADGEYIGTDNYDDIDVSMYLMLADDDINAEHELKDAINNESFKRTYTKLSMPKFKIEYSASLNDMLKNIGIKTAFDSNTAQFEKMFDKGNMWFTDTLHKTYISVDEKGTEASAVTSIGMGGSSLPPEPIELKFNKPFYFAIRDNTSGETLFMGRYAFAE